MSPRLDFARAAMASCMLLAMGGARASSYMLSESDLYYRGSLGYTQATQTWNTAGDLQDIGCKSQRTNFSNQLQYGYSYYYTLFANLGLVDAQCGPSSKKGFSDLNLGVRGRINPYMNRRSWEVDVTIPTHSRTPSRVQIGCGVYGAGARADFTDPLAPWLSVGYGAGVNLWQAPLSHQFNAQGSLGGPIGAKGVTPWLWSFGAAYDAPLTARPADPVAAAGGCGTQARVLRVTPEVRYQYTRNVTLGCAYEAAVRGKDVNRSTGLSCAYTYYWH